MTPIQRAIILEAAVLHGVTLEEIVGPARVRRIATARQEAMYRLRLEGRWSLPLLGRVLGGRDHTTVMFGCRRHAERHGLIHVVSHRAESRKPIERPQSIGTCAQRPKRERRHAPGMMKAVRRRPARAANAATQPTPDVVRREVGIAAAIHGAQADALYTSSRHRSVVGARKHAWASLLAQGYSINGISKTWGCERKSIYRLRDEITSAAGMAAE